MQSSPGSFFQPAASAWMAFPSTAERTPMTSGVQYGGLEAVKLDAVLLTGPDPLACAGQELVPTMHGKDFSDRDCTRKMFQDPHQAFVLKAPA